MEEGEIPPFPCQAELPTKVSWSSVVAADSPNRPRLKYFPPSVKDGIVSICPPPEVLKKGRDMWCNSLVGYFLHSKLPFKVVEPIVHKLWGKMGLSKVLLHDKGYYIFKFASTEARENVLAMGPWYISNKQLLLKKWKEGIDFSSEPCSKAPIWVKFHGIPLSYWTDDGLSCIASGIGKPLFLDKATERLDPLPYARMCVEIDVEAAMPKSLAVPIRNEDEEVVRTIDVSVEYQNRPPSCSVCKSFGHSLLKCPASNFQWVPKAAISTADAVKAPTSNVAASTQPVMSASPVPGSNPIPADEGWTPVLSNRPASSLQQFPPALSPGNKYAVLGEPESPDCNSINLPPNPLTEKLKIVDEKECRDLKMKSNVEVVGSPSAKRRNKGRGRNSPT